MLTQKNRQMGIVKSPLGDDVLVAWKLRGREELSRPFLYELEMLSEESAVDFEKIVDQAISIRLDVEGAPARYFHGHVSSFEQLGIVGRLHRYRATLEPWTAFMSRRKTCRIFQGKTLLEILEVIFADYETADYKFLGPDQRAYHPRDYCVQYCESDLDFVSRLLEEEGVYYYYEHTAEGHSVVLCDELGTHGTYFEGSADEQNCLRLSKGFNNVDSWVFRREARSQSYRHGDFDFRIPGRPVAAVKQIEGSGAEVYEYPGRFSEEIFTYPGKPGESGKHNEFDAAEQMAAARAEELVSLSRQVTAVTEVARGISPGYIFSVGDHPRADQNGNYLTVSADIRVEADDYQGDEDVAQELPFTYTCSFKATPEDLRFRSARVTPRPQITGPQTATVVGPADQGSGGSSSVLSKLKSLLGLDSGGGEIDIYADEFGRVKVKFHWDLEESADERNSCWVRVVQPWAGGGFGAQFTPRVGHEVVVAFIDGDLDRPLITGSVYNGTNEPPYDPAAHPTISTIKSRTSGEGAGANELRFEDKKEAEQIFLHAQKDLHVRVVNDRLELSGNDRHLVVKNDKFEHVENNRNEKVVADHKEEIGKDRHLKVTGKEAKEVGGSLSLVVKEDMVEEFKKNHSEQTASDYYLKAKNVVIEGMQNITLCVGGSSIAIEASGIEIKTSGNVKIEGTGVEAKATAGAKIEGATTEIKGSATAKLEGAKVEVKGSAMGTLDGGGMTEVKGGLVKIN